VVEGDEVGVIRVQKSAVVPERLRVEGWAETEALKKAYDDGKREFTFTSDRLHA
jgi:hypothetical protein